MYETIQFIIVLRVTEQYLHVVSLPFNDSPKCILRIFGTGAFVNGDTFKLLSSPLPWRRGFGFPKL